MVVDHRVLGVQVKKDQQKADEVNGKYYFFFNDSNYVNFLHMLHLHSKRTNQFRCFNILTFILHFHNTEQVIYDLKYTNS